MLKQFCSRRRPRWGLLFVRNCVWNDVNLSDGGIIDKKEV